jgi:AcrR family transcriptional regulator
MICNGYPVVMTSTRARRTRQRLLDATVDSLRAKGIDGLTSREIAGSAGVNLQAITYHFGSKDALVAEALTELVRRRLDPVREALETPGEPSERLFHALGTISSAFDVSRADLRAYADAVAAASTNAELARSLGSLHDELVAYLAQLIAEMRAEGYIQPWVEPEPMAAVLIALGDGIAAQSRLSDPDVAAMLDQVALLLLSARGQSTRIWPAAARALLRRMRPS